MTAIKFRAAIFAGTVGCRSTYFSVKDVATVPGCKATNTAFRWLRAIRWKRCVQSDLEPPLHYDN